MPYGLVEIGLAFGLPLAWAVWETVRTRRELARLKREAGSRSGPGPKSGPSNS